MGWVLLAVFVTLVMIVYNLYARMIRLKNTAFEALAGIDVQLRKRHDLIPNVLKLARRYMEHEQDLLEKVTDLRTKAETLATGTGASDVKERFSAEGALMSGLGNFFARMEAYPDLKADNAIVEAQEAYQEVEGHISAARRFYNSAVADLNTAIETFPGVMIAPLAKAEPLPLYEVEDAAVRDTVNADDFLK